MAGSTALISLVLQPGRKYNIVVICGVFCSCCCMRLKCGQNCCLSVDIWGVPCSCCKLLKILLSGLRQLSHLLQLRLSLSPGQLSLIMDYISNVSPTTRFLPTEDTNRLQSHPLFPPQTNIANFNI
jgi:hypothetical protein